MQLSKTSALFLGVALPFSSLADSHTAGLSGPIYKLTSDAVTLNDAGDKLGIELTLDGAGTVTGMEVEPMGPSFTTESRASWQQCQEICVAPNVCIYVCPDNPIIKPNPFTFRATAMRDGDMLRYQLDALNLITNESVSVLTDPIQLDAAGQIAPEVE